MADDTQVEETNVAVNDGQPVSIWNYALVMRSQDLLLIH